MKQILCAALLLAFAACGNNKTTESKTESAPVTPGIDNVNGNVPDTTTTIRLNQPLPKDSSRANDSVPR